MSRSRTGSGRAWRSLLLLLVLAVATTAVALAAEEALGIDPATVIGPPAGPPRSGAELEAATEHLSKRLRCPVCQGLSVADSPSASALAMRNEIQSLLARGYSEEQIGDYFESTYGEFVRLVPKAKGFNWLVWIAPAVALLLGFVAIVWLVRRPRGGGPGRPDESEDLSDWEDRVRQEISS